MLTAKHQSVTDENSTGAGTTMILNGEDQVRAIIDTAAGTATVAIQVSADGSTWVTISVAAGDRTYLIEAPGEYVRGNVTINGGADVCQVHLYGYTEH